MSDIRWTMPSWMRKYEKYILDGEGSVEEVKNTAELSSRVVYLNHTIISARVELLKRLHEAGILE